MSASLMGITTRGTLVCIYMLSSGLAALSGIVFSVYTSAGYALAGVGVELDAIASVVIGGTLLSGGVGTVLGMLFGVAIQGVIQTWIDFDGALSSRWTRIAIGALLFIFIALQRADGAVGIEAECAGDAHRRKITTPSVASGHQFVFWISSTIKNPTNRISTSQDIW